MRPTATPASTWKAIIDRTDQEQRVAALGARLTLNGESALIGGVRMDFATLTQSANGHRARFSWHAAFRGINAKDGEFRS